MTWTRDISKPGIVGRVSVKVSEHDSQWCSRGMTFIHSADNLRYILLHARGSPSGSALTALYVLDEVLLSEFESRRDTVHDHSYEFTMGFSKDTHSEFSSVRVHIVNV
jgi:hypothetical protein